jgi:hypothetical protein
VSPVKYELGFYIPEDGILHSHRRENLKSYTFRNSPEVCFVCLLTSSLTYFYGTLKYFHNVSNMAGKVI